MKKEDKQLLILKALNFFIESPYDEIYLREYARKLKISPNSAQRFLEYFLKQGFVFDFRKGNLRYFKANLNSITFKHIKIAFSLKQLEDSGLINELNNYVAHCVLFGSMAKGLDDLKSDLDILIIGKDKVKIKTILSDFQLKFKRIINLQVFTDSDWIKQKKENKAFYQEIVSNGINLIGETPI